MKSRRFSLYLLGSPPSSTPCYLEGEIYGIHWFKRDVQRTKMAGHSIKALKVDLTKFPVESLSSIADSPTLKLDLDFYALLSPYSDAEGILTFLWQVPRITSLDIKYCYIDGDFAKQIKTWGPPAFAQTLRSVKTTSSLDFLDFLAPHCRNIQEIEADGFYETIMANNPGLTALTVWSAGSSIDMNQHAQLAKLSVYGVYKLFSQNPTSRLEDVSLQDPYLPSARTFLIQCSPSLTHLTLRCKYWQDIVQLVNVLNPDKCKRLTLHVRSRVDAPSLDQVGELILKKGFEVTNEDFFLLSVKDINEKGVWEKLVGIAPNILKMQALHGDERMDQLINCFSPSFFTAFRDLTVIQLTSHMQWDQATLLSLVKCCSVVRELTFSTSKEFVGMVELESSSLKKLSLEFAIGYPSWKLRLCNLTHFSLSLPVGEDGFLVKFLNGDQFIFLPQLRVLSIFNTGSCDRIVAVVPCQAGHPSLTHLLVKGAAMIGKITLRNLPDLRQISLESSYLSSIVLVDVPGDCDVSLSGRATYTRQGFFLNRKSPRTFTAEIHYDADSRAWFEITKSE